MSGSIKGSATSPQTTNTKDEAEPSARPARHPGPRRCWPIQGESASRSQKHVTSPTATSTRARSNAHHAQRRLGDDATDDRPSNHPNGGTMRQLCPRHQSISQPDRNPAGHAWAGTVDIDRPRRPRRRSAPPATQSTRYHRTSQRLRLLVWAAALVGTAAGCQASPAQQDANPSATSPITAPATGHGRSGSAATEAALVGAGDIALCRGSHDEATADLLDHIPGAVFTAGDNAYEDGSTKDYGNCFQPSWGRHRDRIRPAPGNHEYHTAGARAYCTYFGATRPRATTRTTLARGTSSS